MKFKLFSAVLLLVCFVFLGVLTGGIPVKELPDDMAAGLFSAFAAAPSPEPPKVSATPSIVPSAKPAPASTPARQASPAPAQGRTSAPERTPEGLPEVPRQTALPPEAAASPTAVPAATEAPVTEAPAPASTAEAPVMEAPAPAAAETSADVFWEPDAEVIATTITWSEPLQNETSYQLEETAALLDQAPDITLPGAGPQILIIHTHGTEAYTPDGEDQYEASGDYRTTDAEHSIIQVGQALGEALRSCGLNVLVDTGLYDWPNYDGAYARSGQAIQTYLEQNPGIQVVIDLHRDAIGDDTTIYKTVSDELMPEAAQIMFVIGTDENLTHPNWRENLRFAMSLQGVLEDQYPHIMRPTLLSTSRYNQQLTPASVLLEIGTAGNTLQEALTSAKLFAQAVGPVLAACIGV